MTEQIEMTGTWIQREISLANKHGLHMRPAQRIVETAVKFKSDIRAVKDSIDCNAKSILDMIEFAAHMVRNTRDDDNCFLFRACGADAQEALEALGSLVEQRFNLE